MEFTKTKKEQAEDALFTALLDSVLQLEAQQLDVLPRSLEPMPDMIDRNALSTIQREFDLLQFGGQAKIRTKRILRYILIVAAILATLLTIIYASRSASRPEDLELSVEKTPYSLDFSMFDPYETELHRSIPREEVESELLQKKGFSFPLAPEGYAYDAFKSVTDRICWTHENNRSALQFHVYDEMPSSFLKLENAAYEEIRIADHNGWRVQKVHSPECTTVAVGWTDQTTDKFLLVVGTNTDFETISALAQQITHIG